MIQEDRQSLYKAVAKRSNLPVAKTRGSLNALCAAVNFALENGMITLNYNEDSHCGNTIITDFSLLGRTAIVDIHDIGHGELRILVAVPALGINPRVHPAWNMRLGRDYDFFCVGWLERKTGKFIQGVISCRTKRLPWNRMLEQMTINPVGFSISTKFFR